MRISQELTNLLQEVSTTLHIGATLPPIYWDKPSVEGMGHYTSAWCMGAFKVITKSTQNNKYVSVKQLAEEVARELEMAILTSPLKDQIGQIEVAGPGFINVTLSDACLLGSALTQAQEKIELPQLGTKQSVIVEFSSPNIAKPFTIGHLRSTIIGDAIARVLSAAGHTVYRDNHVGDWGTQFGKLLYALETWGSEAEVTQAERPVKVLVDLYVKFHTEAESHPEIENEARLWFKKLEDGDAEARRLWQRCIEWSWVEFDALYKRLGVTFTENEGRGFGESYFETYMPAVIEELRTKHKLQQSEGAEVAYLEEQKLPPLMILKSDGTTLYATRDLATDAFRRQKYGEGVKIINEVGAEQILYFRQLFALEQALGWFTPGQRVHIGHGHYRLKTGKMSTRKGQVIWLEDVLDEATERVKAQAKSALPDQTIQAIAVGAVKWHDLKREPIHDINFDYDEMLSLTGNAGPYIQYSVVRSRKILACLSTPKQSSFEIVMNLLKQKESESTIQEFNMSEKKLLLTLYYYFDTVKKAAEELAPHYLCTYLFELAQDFNSFYAHSQVVGESDELLRARRVTLVAAVNEVLTHGLGLLGISTVDEM
jgi:arginyl-tRNA synthetase